MQSMDFFSLERSIQERFIASARSEAQPLPLTMQKARTPRSALLWGAGCGLCLVALVILSSLGYGDLDSPLALHPPKLVAGYIFLAAASAFCAQRVLVTLTAARSLPYLPGLYMFPSGLIDARVPRFVVRPLHELAKVHANDATLSLEFVDKSRFRFRLPNAQRAREVERAISDLRDRSKAAPSSTRTRELALLDPLCDSGFRNPFSPTESMKPPAPRRISFKRLAWVIVGAAFGFCAFAFRNTIAERTLYIEARAEDSKPAYLAYLKRGGSRADVRDLLLPQAELAEVVAGGSLEALERFAVSRESSAVSKQIEAALGHALRKGLERARDQGNFGALEEFRRKHGQHPSIAPAIELAIEANLKGHLESFERVAQPKPEVRAFFKRLLEYRARHEERVEVRFRRRLAKSVERAETLIRKSRYFAGDDSLPAQYFDATRSQGREEPVARQILAALQRPFPSDLLNFQLAPPMQDSGAELPSVSVPTLLITHATEMSGGYLLKKPRAALTGVSILFWVTFQIPGDPEAIRFKLSTWNVPNVRRSHDFQGYSAIYDEMGARAFERLPKKFLADLMPGLDL